MMQHHVSQAHHAIDVVTVGNFGHPNLSLLAGRILVGRMDQDVSLVPHVSIVAAVTTINIGTVWERQDAGRSHVGLEIRFVGQVHHATDAVTVRHGIGGDGYLHVIDMYISQICILIANLIQLIVIAISGMFFPTPLPPHEFFLCNTMCRKQCCDSWDFWPSKFITSGKDGSNLSLRAGRIPVRSLGQVHHAIDAVTVRHGSGCNS